MEGQRAATVITTLQPLLITILYASMNFRKGPIAAPSRLLTMQPTKARPMQCKEKKNLQQHIQVEEFKITSLLVQPNQPCSKLRLYHFKPKTPHQITRSFRRCLGRSTMEVVVAAVAMITDLLRVKTIIL